MPGIASAHILLPHSSYEIDNTCAPQNNIADRRLGSVGQT